ncbi:thioredoxin family protein [Lacticaseibacillus baoqingensis]|uniref:Thioredoxin family protein n=1 Tax=Lacticaseibacillus baoqingensis TaxID=2486013 RepID=A0ABW4E418_9LACO|nr:thioredoxin family protein [Lacticaseibacillus baoqingensis]
MPAMIELIHDEDYATATKSGIVVVDFRMDFCPACIRMDHTLSQVASDPEIAKRVRFVTLSVNQDFHVAEALGVQSAPSVIVKKAGHIVDAVVGYQPPAAFLERLQQLL